MQNVVLRHETDSVPQFGVVLVQVTSGVADLPDPRRAEPRERTEQRGLPGTGRPDHGQEAALRQREADIVQQHPALLGGHRQP